MPFEKELGHLPDFWILLCSVIFNALRQLYRHRQEVFEILLSALDGLDDFLEVFLERDAELFDVKTAELALRHHSSSPNS